MRNQTKYQTKVVTYFDILGFKQMIEHESAEEIHRVLQIFREVSESDREDEKEFVRGYTNFSDLNLRSILISSIDYLRVRPALLDYEIESVARIQCKLIEEEGIVVSGGMAVGGLVENGGFIFGQGLVNAYLLANKADFPRILVSSELAEVADQNAEERGYSLAKLLIAKEDDLNYVDYLRAAQNDKEVDDLLEFLHSHWELITRNLEEHANKPRVLRKYKWMRKYHNDFVEGKFPGEDLEIAIS